MFKIDDDDEKLEQDLEQNDGEEYYDEEEPKVDEEIKD